MEKKLVKESGRSSENARQQPGPWPPGIEPFFSNMDHNPRELKSWAKRTGFNSTFSGETTPSNFINEGSEATVPPPPTRRDVAFDPILGKRSVGDEINPLKDVERRPEKENKKRSGFDIEVGLEEDRWEGNDLSTRAKDEVMKGGGSRNGEAGEVVAPGNGEPKKEDLEIEVLGDPPDPHNSAPFKSGLLCDLLENPGFGRLVLYGIQQYLSLIGSLVFIPLIMVPTMGGTDGETANVISTILLISGITTIMHSFFGTRLPLVQGSSFVYLAPALVIANSPEYRNLSENKFRHIMRELQGAIIVGSIFQTILGYSGLMSLILRLINPVVVSPTVAAVGLSFFSYGFPQAGSCIGISIPLILLILIFTLYLRKISIFGHRVFLIYAVPVGLAIVWAYAFFLTAGGAYKHNGCSSNIPSSNILSDTCRKHALTMKRCRTDVSVALKMASWVRIPYPCQWGMPTFSLRTSIIMTIVSVVTSVDSIGSYHATSVFISLRPPTPGVASRGIGLEGISGILAGLWGTGTGSTTLTENIYTLQSTKMASRKALAVGAVFLIIFSFVGKLCAVLASIPLALAAAILCFTWSLIVALGLSTLRYTQTASSRNTLIVGFTLFISLSVPAYFQQYPQDSVLVLPSYLVSYAAASEGPIDTGNNGLNYALNSLLSLNMVVALLVAFILDNTVPGSRQERGAYIWSSSRISETDPSSLAPYQLPEKVGCLFRWAKWVGS